MASSMKLFIQLLKRKGFRKRLCHMYQLLKQIIKSNNWLQKINKYVLTWQELK